MKTYLLSSLLLLPLMACKKDDLDPDGLVRATQDGKNTGDFLLNGQPFNPQPNIETPANKPVGASWYHQRKGESSFQISFFREERDINSTRRGLALFLSHVHKPGTYPLVDEVTPFVINGSRSSAQYDVPGPEPARTMRYFLTGPDYPGQVIITRFDTVARVVSGTFEARLRDYDGPETITITKGRFDCSF